LEKGIEKTRLTYKGYGDEKPIDTNDTEIGRANNRRTEFKIIGK
jgi:outer membrane protein OmpA-like peptidoglycan-associated protein